jgi:predicted transcriptional regulator
MSVDENIVRAADIVAAYVCNNPLPANELALMIENVHAQIVAINGGPNLLGAIRTMKSPAVPIERAHAHDHVACFECGLKFKTLKRHLATCHGLTPTAYRARWGLPWNYPLAAEGYVQMRRDLAKGEGLGLVIRKGNSKAAAARRAEKSPGTSSSDPTKGALINAV